MKKILLSELMQIVESARADLTDWTVGFVKAIETPSGDIKGVLSGSGVLVTANGRHAILTAEHVSNALPNSGPVGLVLLTRRGLVDHQFLLEMQFVQKLSVGKGNEDASGPDLALLVLPRSDVGRLEATKMFHNLDKRKPQMIAAPGANQIGPWAMCGLVGEMTQNAKAIAGMSKAIAFKGLCGPVVVPRVRFDGKFDYFSAEVNFGAEHNLPESYAGCSGSGLWWLKLKERKGVYALDEIFLGGIAYYESAPNGSQLFIECHGIKSIYQNALDVLANAPMG